MGTQCSAGQFVKKETSISLTLNYDLSKYESVNITYISLQKSKTPPLKSDKKWLM